MHAAPSQPPPPPESALIAESAALEQLEQIAAIVRGAPTPKVRARALSLIDQLARWPEIQQARHELGAMVRRIRERAEQSGLSEITDEEIQAEIASVRAARGGR